MKNTQTGSMTDLEIRKMAMERGARDVLKARTVLVNSSGIFCEFDQSAPYEKALAIAKKKYGNRVLDHKFDALSGLYWFHISARKSERNI